MRRVILRLIGSMPHGRIKAASRAQWRSPVLKQVFQWCANCLRNQNGVIQQGVGRGLRFNPQNANAGYLLGTSEPGVQRALQILLRPAMTIYDVGANVGFLTVIAARLVTATGRVICFEPLPENADAIRHNASLNEFEHVLVRAEALGKIDGTARFLVSEEPTWGRLASSGTPGKQTAEMNVPIRRLDSVLSETDLPMPHVIKIDVEGAEADVLAGASKLLRSARPLLLIECHGTNVVVADALAELDYLGVVLDGKGQDIASARWDAFVAALPRERAELNDLLSILADLDMASSGQIVEPT